MSLSPASARVLSARLDAELDRVRAEADELQRLADLVARSGADANLLWAAAGHLQAFYTGIEAILLRILKEVDESIPVGPESHQEIARQAGVALPGVRPEVVDADVSEAIAPYRAFRHFFRHAYGLTLRWEKMEDKVAGAREVCEQFAGAVASFREFLNQLGAANS